MSGERQTVFFIKLKGSTAVCVDLPNRSIPQNPGDVIWDHITDTAVTGTFNLAGGDDIPYCNMVPEKKCFLVCNRNRNILMRKRCQQLPEAILWMMIEELCLPGFDRRETPYLDEEGAIKKIDTEKRGKDR